MKFIYLLTLVFLFHIGRAQIKEVNPSIGWNYVNNQELEMLDEVWYNTDFAAETGYDYTFVMNHNLDSIKASIQVFDLQESFIKGKNDSLSLKIHSLEFDVSESGVYRVFFVVDDQKEGSESHKVTFTLIRRKKI